VLGAYLLRKHHKRLRMTADRYEVRWLGGALLIAVCFLLSSCDRSDARLHAKLQGTWILDRTRPDGSIHTRTVIHSDGAYTCQTVARDNSNHVYKFELEGTFETRDGYLIDTVRKHTDTNFPVPTVFRARIISMTDRELVIHDEANSVDGVFEKSSSDTA
jgi:hypothetical protein